ncbi:hypothetical protein J3R03_010429 [Actinoplanes couchii]|uniref:Uncharacterized protein n=1 Tax=Actinoplanes couchii TaxID=403638 RepID=A0ABQ3X4V1_9ACTN|nr:hypothetical protein [Actinoplanes couchii]GID53415.1 hypothetical protein Aco03nite_018190 [Actinoplanes couchii]
MTGLDDMWRSVVLFLPSACAFLVILVAGYLLARLARTVTAKALRRLGFDKAVQRGRVLGPGVPGATDVCARLVFLAVLLISLQLAFGLWGPNPASDLLDAIIAWLPRLFVAIVIVVVTAAAAGAAHDLIVAVLGGLGYARVLARAAAGVIVTLGVIAGLDQIGVATSVTRPLLIAILATVAGVIVVGVGGGLIRPMQRRWEGWLDRAATESATIREQARTHAQSAAVREEARAHAESAAVREEARAHAESAVVLEEARTQAESAAREGAWAQESAAGPSAVELSAVELSAVGAFAGEAGVERSGSERLTVPMRERRAPVPEREAPDPGRSDPGPDRSDPVSERKAPVAEAAPVTEDWEARWAKEARRVPEPEEDRTQVINLAGTAVLTPGVRPPTAPAPDEDPTVPNLLLGEPLGKVEEEPTRFLGGDRGTGEQGTSDRGTGDRGTGEQGTGEQGIGGQGKSGRGEGDRGKEGQGASGNRGSAQSDETTVVYGTGQDTTVVVGPEARPGERRKERAGDRPEVRSGDQPGERADERPGERADERADERTVERPKNG